MKLKIGQMKTKDIMNGIFITGVLYYIFSIPSILTRFLISREISVDSKIIYFLNGRRMYSIHTFVVPILGLILLKLLCEVLYKIVKASEIIIEEHKNN